MLQSGYLDIQWCNVALKLTYSFSYGKKTKRGDVTVDKSTKDAILKGY